MVRSSRIGLALALLTSASLGLSSARAQDPTPPPLPRATSGPSDYNPLPDLPHPLDAPRNLLAPAPATPTSTCAPLPNPDYFVYDPLLDDRQLPQPGFFASVEIAAVVPHIYENIQGQVQFGGRSPDTVQLPNAPLDWTVAPSVTLGYRLPSGFGDVTLSYRGFASQGTESYLAADGPASLKSRVDLNQIDLKYLSREFSLWPKWDMTWHVGLSYSTVYYDSTSNESIAEAEAGSRVFQQHSSNSWWGLGPNAGLELTRRFEGTGLSFLTHIDGTNYLGRLNQNFTETGTATDASGAFLSGQTRNSGSESVPVLNIQAGIQYDLPQLGHSSVFLGYVYEYWWDIGRLSGVPGSVGQMSDQGITFRAFFSF
jgi:hypothetical protein